MGFNSGFKGLKHQKVKYYTDKYKRKELRTRVNNNKEK